jgi:hypothetical protein
MPRLTHLLAERLPPNGLELSCPAEAGSAPLLYGTPAGRTSHNQCPARRVSFSELLGGSDLPTHLSRLRSYAHPYGVTLL